MYAGIDENQIVENVWNMAKGNISLGKINVSFDLTEGLSEEQFKERWLRNVGLWQPKHYITKSGRILIPELNIY